MLRILLYLVDSTGCLLPAGAAARLHHIADVLSGGQQLGHVHGGLRLQGVSLRLVGPRHAVHPYLTNHTAHVWNHGFAISSHHKINISPIISTGLDSPLIKFWWLVIRACLGSVGPPEWLNRDVQPFDQHPAPTLVLGWQSCVHVVQLLLQRLTRRRKKKKVKFKWTLYDTNYTQQLTYRHSNGLSNLLTHCSLDRDFISTGSPTEPLGRSLSVSST